MVEVRADVGMQPYGHASVRLPRRGPNSESIAAELRAGRIATAVHATEAALSAPVDGAERARLVALRGLALALSGQTEEALTLLAAASDATNDVRGQVTIWSCWAEAALWGGLPRLAIDRASDVLDCQGAATDEVRALLARAWAQLELGQPSTPLRLRASMEPSEPIWAAGLGELRGVEAMSRGMFGPAATAFLDAAGRWVDSDAARALACGWAAGEALRRAGDESAGARLRATLDAAVEMGFEPLAARVRRSLRLAGQRPAGPRAKRPAGRLTSREREILELVERGRTNDEIARRMGLGRPTVARLLSNAMLKLGAESRAHAIVIHGSEGAAADDERASVSLHAPAIPSDARAILSRIALGRTLGAIARELGLSRRTADRRLADARAALGAARTTEAVALAQRLGWLA